jgi:hypothetical protein
MSISPTTINNTTSNRAFMRYLKTHRVVAKTHIGLLKGEIKMGRPLNKKYFGNRNVGADGFYTGDEFIGGEGVGGVTPSNIGAYLERIPAVTFKTPSEPTGVRATGTVTHVQAVGATINQTGSGYNYGDTFTVNGGTGTAATFSVTSLITVATTLNNGGTAIDNGDEYTFSGSYAGGTWTVPLVVHIDNAITGTVRPGGYHIVTPGVWSGASHPATTAGATVTQTAAGQDYNGAGLVLNLTSWGANSVALVAGGDYTAVNAGPTLMNTVTGTGSGCYTNVYYGVKTVSITEKGSGYISVADALPTFSTVSGSEVRATGAAVLTIDSAESTSYRGYGDLNVDTYQENAILIYAKTTSSGTVQLGDIKKQTNARSYKVLTADGTAVCKLVATTPAVGQATITATDSSGKTYYVTKLTAHKALLVPYGATGHQFPTTGTEADGSPIYQSVKWTFGSATDGQTVTVANA